MAREDSVALFLRKQKQEHEMQKRSKDLFRLKEESENLTEAEK